MSDCQHIFVWTFLLIRFFPSCFVLSVVPKTGADFSHMCFEHLSVRFAFRLICSCRCLFEHIHTVHSTLSGKKSNSSLSNSGKCAGLGGRNRLAVGIGRQLSCVRCHFGGSFIFIFNFFFVAASATFSYASLNWNHNSRFATSSSSEGSHRRLCKNWLFRLHRLSLPSTSHITHTHTHTYTGHNTRKHVEENAIQKVFYVFERRILFAICQCSVNDRQRATSTNGRQWDESQELKCGIMFHLKAATTKRKWFVMLMAHAGDGIVCAGVPVHGVVIVG